MRASYFVLLALAACGPMYPDTRPTAPAGSDPAGTDPATGAPGQPDDPYAGRPPGSFDSLPEVRPAPAPTSAPGASAPGANAPGPNAPGAGAPGPTGSNGGAGVPRDMQALLAAHNEMRAKHCAAPLTWSPVLAKAAAAWAAKLDAAGCAFEHSPGNQYGENLAGGSPGLLDGSSVTAMWYDEVAKYDFKRGGFSMETGHFTQLVWRGTTEVGCARAACRDEAGGTGGRSGAEGRRGGIDIWVCEYSPPGNMDGAYKPNVLPTSCQ